MKGFSLLELVLALGMFVLIISSVGLFAVDASRVSQNARQTNKANYFIREISNAILLNKQQSWGEILDNSDGSAKIPVFEAGRYSFEDGVIERDGVEISFVVEDVYRNPAGDFTVESNPEASIDLNSKKITISASWTDFLGTEQNVASVVYANGWNTESFFQSLESQFNAGDLNEVVVQSGDDGELVLNSTSFDDWCEPEVTEATYDLPGSGNPTILSSVAGQAYVGASGAGTSFQSLDIDHGVQPATVNVVGSLDQYSTNSIFGEENFAYIATDDNNKEVAIIDTEGGSLVEVGFYDAPGSTNAESVFVSGDVGYVAQGRRVRSFDLSSKTGERAGLDTITTAGWFGYVTDITVRGDYLFAALFNDWYEMAIIDVSDPTNMRLTSLTDVNFQQTTDLYISEDGNRAYFGTDNFSWFDEFFILDTTEKSGSRPIIGSYDTGSMSVRGVAVIDERAIVVGVGGEEYQVLDISNESNPQYCGGLEENTGLSGVTTVRFDNGDTYSYVIGPSDTAEFRIVKGGPGSTGGGNYSPEGTFVSEVLDTSIADPRYLLISWQQETPANTNIAIQLRASDNSNMSASTGWVGPDGTSTTEFTDPAGSYTPEVLNGLRYLQYRVQLRSLDGVSTPTFSELELRYE
ncbi:MAG: hypothetical protein ACOCXP_01830 [Candidatus Dojkabacteria bacterium]